MRKIHVNMIKQEKKKKVVVLCSRPRQNERTGNFTDVVVVQRGLRNAQKSVIHVQSCFANTNLLLFCCSTGGPDVVCVTE